MDHLKQKKLLFLFFCSDLAFFFIYIFISSGWQAIQEFEPSVFTLNVDVFLGPLAVSGLMKHYFTERSQEWPQPPSLINSEKEANERWYDSSDKCQTHFALAPVWRLWCIVMVYLGGHSYTQQRGTCTRLVYLQHISQAQQRSISPVSIRWLWAQHAHCLMCSWSKV